MKNLQCSLDGCLFLFPVSIYACFFKKGYQNNLKNHDNVYFIGIDTFMKIVIPLQLDMI